MSPLRILILIVALGAAGMAALLLGGFLGGRNKAVAAAGPVVEMTEVLVAAKDIDVGHTVLADDLKWQKWPKDALSAPFITKDSHPAGLEGMVGAVARTVLFTGEPATDAKLVRAESSSFMAATLAPGMRAVSVEISEETGAGGFILPNDRVDVVVTIEGANATDGVKRVMTRTLLQNIRVLAVGQTFRDSAGATDTGGDSQNVAAKTATLEVSPAEAELIQQGGEAGTLSLALRGLTGADTPIAALRVPAGTGNAPKRTNNVITIIRFGEVSQVQAAGNQ
jgi:pilus assembly protein CpaB